MSKRHGLNGSGMMMPASASMCRGLAASLRAHLKESRSSRRSDPTQTLIWVLPKRCSATGNAYRQHTQLNFSKETT